MKTLLEPPSRAEEDDVLRALVSIIATTRRHWNLPADRRPAGETNIGAARRGKNGGSRRREATRPY